MQSHSLRKGFARATLAAFVLNLGFSPAQAVDIPLGIDLSALASTGASITSVRLVKWRTGSPNPNATFPTVTGMTFQYLESGTNLALPNRTNPADNSANPQNIAISDVAAEIIASQGNVQSSAVLMYTANPGEQNGLVSTDGNSTLPLWWKALDAATLAANSQANVNGSVKITNALFMPTVIRANAGGACPAEGPYAASNRTNDGACDYSFKRVVNQNSSRFYTNLAGQEREDAFNYASVLNTYGVATTEQGQGVGDFSPIYTPLAVDFLRAQRTTYSTTIKVEVRTY